MSPDVQKLIDRLPEPLRKDAKKTLVLGGLMVAFAVVLYVQFFRGRGEEASAATATDAAPAAAATPDAPAAPAPSPQVPRVQRWLEGPAARIDRNVFQLRPENFQSAAGPAQATRVTTVSDGTFWDELEKSLAARADQNRQRQVWVDNIVAAAGGLTLQTTIMGQSPAAMVNGRRVGVGDTIERPLPGTRTIIPFRVVAIEPRQLVIEYQSLRLAVPMAGEVNPAGAPE